MTLATRGAGILADAVGGLDLDRMPSTVDLAHFSQMFHQVIGRRRKIGEVLQGVLARRRFSETLAASIGRIPYLARVLVAQAAGFRPG